MYKIDDFCFIFCLLTIFEAIFLRYDWFRLNDKMFKQYIAFIVKIS